MEILFLLIAAAFLLLFGKVFIFFLEIGIWLLALPFKILGSIIGLVAGSIAMLVFFPILLAMLLPFIVVGLLVGGCIYMIN